MGGDPYRATRTRTARQSVSELDQFVARIRALGADDDQVHDVVENWDNFESGFTIADRNQLVRSTDTQLREQIMASQDEFRYATTTDEDDDFDRHVKAVAEAEIEALDLMTLPVPKLVEWVGEDRARAIAVSNLEDGPDGGHRKTLLDAVQRIITGAA